MSTRWLLPRVASRSASVGSTLGVAAGMPLVGLAPSGWVLFWIFVAYGASDAVTDVSMNVAGVEAQRRLGRAVLNSMHGIWSIGAVSADLIGSAAAEFTVPLCPAPWRGCRGLRRPGAPCCPVGARSQRRSTR